MSLSTNNSPNSPKILPPVWPPQHRRWRSRPLLDQAQNQRSKRQHSHKRVHTVMWANSSSLKASGIFQESRLSLWFASIDYLSPNSKLLLLKRLQLLQTTWLLTHYLKAQQASSLHNSSNHNSRSLQKRSQATTLSHGARSWLGKGSKKTILKEEVPTSWSTTTVSTIKYW